MTSVEPEQESGGGNFLTQKYGPLPAWGWGAIAMGLAYLYLRYTANKQKTSAATTGTGTTSGASNALSSNLVAYSQPQPGLNGTYQVTVAPENAPNPMYASTTNSSTQGVANGGPSSGSLQPGSIPVTSTQDVQPQTQPSSPQTQSTPTTG